MSSTNPDSKPANLITDRTQRDWCWNVVFMLFLQRIINTDFPNWVSLISREYKILTAILLHYHDYLRYNRLRQAYQRNSLSLFE